MPELTYLQAIQSALREELTADENVFLIGEDIGEYGGVFKVTAPLWQEFGPARLLDAPISENTIIGAAVGAALSGMRPVAEVMFMDFITLAMDQIVNQAAKLHFMSGSKVKVPLVVRTQAGGGVGAAAQHSQSLEAWFAHIPGLKVVMPSTSYDAKGLLKTAIRDDNPVIFIEHKLLYQKKGQVPDWEYTVPFGQADIKRKGNDLTVVATSYMVAKALAVAESLEREGVSVEVVDPRTLVPLDEETIINSVKKTGRAVVVHEAVKRGGFGGEIASLIAEKAFDWLDEPVQRVGSADAPVPFAPGLERRVIPQEEDIAAAIRRIL